MTRRIPAAAAVIFAVIAAAARCLAQANETANAAAATTQPAPAQKILEKNPEFVRLLDPPTGDEFLQAYSKGFRDKAAEIETKVADISDQKLRGQARADEWSNLPKKDLDKFKAEADLAYYDAKISFLSDHRDAWIEVGLPSYDANGKFLEIKSIPAAALDAKLHVAMTPDTINQVYEKFRKLAGPVIEEKTRAYVSKAGEGSMCARNSEWCYKVETEEVERSERSSRLIVVAQGDFVANNIERLLLVDYVTETVLLELSLHISPPDSIAWRFSTEPPPPAPPEQPPAETQAQSAAPAPAQGVASSGKPAEGPGNAAEPALVPPALAKTPEPEPHSVTAASIVEQQPPIYPEKARAAHVQGEVVLQAKIDKEGKISEVHVLSGDDLLAPSAVEAVRHWRYKPLLVDGAPTETETTITITFSLNE